MSSKKGKEDLDKERILLIREIDRLEKELKQREEQLPAHSIRPHQIVAIEKLEEEIREKKERLHRIEKRFAETRDAGAA
jgi:hypothetical protein